MADLRSSLGFLAVQMRRLDGSPAVVKAEHTDDDTNHLGRRQFSIVLVRNA